MEGVAHEAASLAGHLRLGKLICLYDANRISLAGATDLSFTEDVGAAVRRLRLARAARRRRQRPRRRSRARSRRRRPVADKPSLIVVRTQIGYGSPKQDTFGVHGSPLDAEQVVETKKALGYPSIEPFFVPQDALAEPARLRSSAGSGPRRSGSARFAAYCAGAPGARAASSSACCAASCRRAGTRTSRRSPPTEKPIATRAAGGKVINAIAARVPELVGGSADLNPSTETALKGAGDFEPPVAPGRRPPGRGRRRVGLRRAQPALRRARARDGRDRATASRATAGCIPFSATFFTFSDYMRPAIRLAAIMKAHVDLRLHARQHRRRRGRPDAPAGRARRRRCARSRS